MDNRTTIPIGLTPEARKIVDGLKDSTGINKQEAVAKVLEWFASQSPDVRKAILYGHDASAELVKEKMATMSAGGELPATLQEASHAAKLALDRVIYLAEGYKREAKDEQVRSPKKK